MASDPVWYPEDTTALQMLSKAALGLDQVDNTSDVNKPISSATNVALAGKADVMLANVAVNAATARTNINAQMADATLTALAGVVTSADVLIYATGADLFSTTALTSVARTFMAASTVAAQRTALGLGTLATASTVNNSNWSGDDLDLINGGTGASTASAARTNLGLGSVAVLNAGPGAGTVPVLDGSGRYPALDGSQITNITTSGGGLYSVGTRAISATGTITVADKGKLLLITATAGTPIVLTCASAATLGAGFYCGVKRTDGVFASVTIAAASGEAVDGQAAIFVYQESFDLISTGATPLVTAGRQKIVPAGYYNVTGASLASYTSTAGFGDAEASGVDMQYSMTAGATGNAQARLDKGGGPITTSTYGFSYTGSSGSTAQSSGTATATAGVLSSNNSTRQQGRLSYMSKRFSTGLAQTVETRMLNADVGANASGSFNESTAADIVALQLLHGGGALSALSFYAEVHRL